MPPVGARLLGSPCVDTDLASLEGGRALSAPDPRVRLYGLKCYICMFAQQVTAGIGAKGARAAAVFTGAKRCVGGGLHSLRPGEWPSKWDVRG